MTSHYEPRAPFAAQGTKSNKRSAGRTDVPETPLEVRSANGEINEDLRSWIYERLSRQLGKYGPQIERIEVRFTDVNGDRGGVGKSCHLHVVLSSLPPVAIETTGETEREAFDLAAGRAERATRKIVDKHGFSTRSVKRTELSNGDGANTEPVQEDTSGWTVDDSTVGDGAYEPHVHTHHKPDASLTLHTRVAAQSSKAQAERAAARRVR
ncbi:MAG TPA: HPF/RaiA family ribosome-associated protein [Polyangiales bacterium]|nr:HPF/RaiA family ribosome-associated protein [Polyangiales bacterium]